jgi:hypothetical protein
MAVKFTNNAKTTLASGINSTATSATVADGSVFPTLEAGEYFYCTFDDDTNNEIVKVTARSSNTLTIVRGVDNTTARAFLSGDAAELRATSALLTDIQANIAAKSANQTVYNATTASSATAYDIGIDPGVEGNAMVFLNGLMQHHDTFSFSGSTLTLDTAPADGMALEVIVDNLINLQSSNLTVDTFTAADVGGNPQVTFTLSDAPAAETNLIVFVDGVFQANDTYTISNLTLSMTDGVTAGLTVTVYVMNPVNIGAPSDGTVTTSKLSGNITMPGTLTVGAFDVAFDSPTFFVDHTNSRVGLGTASPTVPVDIVGDVKMSAALTVSGLTNLASPVQVRNATQNFNGGLSTEVNTGLINFGLNEGSANRFGGSYTQANQGGFMHFDTRAGEPLFQLYGRTAGTADATGSILFQIDSTGNTVFNEGGVDADFRVESDTNTHALFVQGSDGNVGIGVSSPTAKIHATTATAGYTAKLINTNGASDANGLLIQAGTVGSEYALNVSNTAGSSIYMVVKGDGKVGIGTSSPANPLHVVDSRNYLHSTTADSSTNMSGIRVINSNNNNNWAGVWFATGSEGGTHWSGIAGARTNATGNWGTHLSFFTHEDATVNLTTATERMRINSYGALVLQEGNPIYADTGRVVNFTMPVSYGNALNFATLGGVNAATGFYLVTVVKNSGSVGTHWVGLIGVSTSGNSYIYSVIQAAGILAQMSGSWLQLQHSAAPFLVHITAVPIGITGNDS